MRFKYKTFLFAALNLLTKILTKVLTKIYKEMSSNLDDK